MTRQVFCVYQSYVLHCVLHTDKLAVQRPIVLVKRYVDATVVDLFRTIPRKMHRGPVCVIIGSLMKEKARCKQSSMYVSGRSTTSAQLCRMNASDGHDALKNTFPTTMHCRISTVRTKGLVARRNIAREMPLGNAEWVRTLLLFLLLSLLVCCCCCCLRRGGCAHGRLAASCTLWLSLLKGLLPPRRALLLLLGPNVSQVDGGTRARQYSRSCKGRPRRRRQQPILPPPLLLPVPA